MEAYEYVSGVDGGDLREELGGELVGFERVLAAFDDEEDDAVDDASAEQLLGLVFADEDDDLVEEAEREDGEVGGFLLFFAFFVHEPFGDGALGAGLHDAAATG